MELQPNRNNIIPYLTLKKYNNIYAMTPTYPQTDKRGSGFAVRLVSLIVVFCILASFAIVRDGHLFGHDFRTHSTSAQSASLDINEAKQTVINTTDIGKDIVGYKGPVPLEIYISAGKVDSVKALPNQETPGFFERASVLLNSWNGLTLEEAAVKRVDAVSGATFSSNAIKGNFQAGINKAVSSKSQEATASADACEPEGFTVEYTLALIVAIAAAILPLFVKNKNYRLVQQLLNVGVLGFWAGAFLDYSVFIRTFAGSLPLALSSLLTLLLFAVAFIYPLFGRTGHYCAWVCPLGSLQDLAGHLHIPKLHISPAVAKAFSRMRVTLWCILMFCLWSGLGASWIDYELFSAFLVKSASVTVLITGGAFLILSLIVTRPFCRFVCPTGTLLRLSEGKGIPRK